MLTLPVYTCDLISSQLALPDVLFHANTECMDSTDAVNKIHCRIRGGGEKSFQINKIMIVLFLDVCVSYK